MEGIIGYWNAIVREYENLNKVSHRFTRPLLVSAEVASKGYLENPWQETRAVYVLPFTASSLKDSLSVLVPLWLPAVLTAEGQLMRRPESFAVPYIPFTFLEADTPSGIVLAKRAFYERALLESMPSAWSQWYSAACACLDKVSEGAWQAHLSEAEYVLNDSVWVVDAAEVQQGQDILAFEAPILKALLAPMEDEDPLFWEPETLGLNDLLKHLMELPEGELQAIQLPDFKEKNRLLHAFLERVPSKQRVCVLTHNPEAWSTRAISEEIRQLQAKDEALEGLSDSLHRLLVLWQKQQKKAQSGWRQWMGWMLPSKKKDFELFFAEFRQQPKEIQERFQLEACSFDEIEMHLVEALSQVRVDRTCLHRTLSTVCDRQPVVQIMEPASASTAGAGQSWDLCILDEAQLLAPWQVISILAHAKKAWVLAHPSWPKRSPSVPSHLDYQCAYHYQCIRDEMDFETLEWSGCSATGTVWQWICAKNTRAPLIWAKEPKTEAEVLRLAVQGRLESKAGSLYNTQEANAIVDWVLAHSERDIAIVSAFAAQQSIIQKALTKAGLNTPVYLLGAVNVRPHEVLLFSATYEASAKRPFVFDLGEEGFNCLNAMALKAIVLVGDEKLWDMGVHSPSGRLAKRCALSAVSV